MIINGAISLATMAISPLFGVQPDFSFLTSSILQAGQNLLISAKKYAGKIAAGAAALVESFREGTFGRIFSQWARESPFAAGAGVVAAGLAGGVILIVGGAVVGTVLGGIGKVIASMKGTAIGTAILGGLGYASIQGLGTVAVQVSNFLWNFNWNQTDSSIEEEIKAAINGLYSPAGQVLGRGLATLLIGGKWQPTRVEVNVRQAAYQYLINEDARDELLSSISALVYAAVNAFKVIVIKRSYMKGRRGLKKAWQNLPPEFRESMPGVDRAIQAWGEEESKAFSLASEYEEKVVDKIEDDKIKNLLEGFTEGFTEQLSQGVIWKYG